MTFTKQQTILAHAIGIPVLLIASFYGGILFEKSKTSVASGNQGSSMQANGAGGFAGGSGRSGGRGGANGAGGFASGTILSKDATSIVIQMRTGGSKIVLLSDTTQVVKSDQGALTDLLVNDNVTVTGTANPDGSVTAQSIQIRPAVPATAPTPTATTPTPATK